MADWMQISRAVVFPWHCDQYGHMNVRWYAHFFDDASFLSWSCLDLDMLSLHEAGTHTAVARNAIEFKQELRAGAQVAIDGRFSAIGTTSVQLQQRMTEQRSGKVCATHESVLVFCDTSTRQAVAVPPEIRARLIAAGATTRTPG